MSNLCEREINDSEHAEQHNKLLGHHNKKLNYENFEQTNLDDLTNFKLTKDTTCGLWILKGKFLQRFSNQTAYVIVYGLVGCLLGMTHSYFNGIISTLEKRFKISSRNSGIITVAASISELIFAIILGYYGGRGHRPRWIGFGLVTIAISCFLTAAPQLIYGAGEDALALTSEYGAITNINETNELIEKNQLKLLCQIEGSKCHDDKIGSLEPQILLFVAQFISGIGGSVVYTLGIAYMDDNSKKGDTPTLISITNFINLLGPASGYALVSFCLKYYIAPNLHPVITNEDPRWLGSWWLGWLVLGILVIVSAVAISLFPRELPAAAARKAFQNSEENIDSKPSLIETSFQDLVETLKRLNKNKIFFYNVFSSIFYFFGYMPYWIFTPKYIEIQYKQTASDSSMATGTVALVFTALGVLSSGLFISRFKPKARSMAAWNLLVAMVSMLGMISYVFIGCAENEQSLVINNNESLNITTCNSDCHCDYVSYSPICGVNNKTYISPCHAGCRKQYKDIMDQRIYDDCSCIPSDKFADSQQFSKSDNLYVPEYTTKSTILENIKVGGQAKPGACPVSCRSQFLILLSVMCFLKFVGATARTSSFLLSIRAVDENDKTVAMGYGMMIISVLTFIPAPIFFGWIFDSLCLVWGKTCTNKGNCWVYDAEQMRYTLNLTASAFIAVSIFLEVGVWYYVKDLKIFDDEKSKKKIEK